MAGHVSVRTDLRGHINRKFLIKEKTKWANGGVGGMGGVHI